MEKHCSNCKLYSFKTKRCPHGSTIVPYNVCCDKWEACDLENRISRIEKALKKLFTWKIDNLNGKKANAPMYIERLYKKLLRILWEGKEDG